MKTIGLSICVAMFMGCSDKGPKLDYTVDGGTEPVMDASVSDAGIDVVSPDEPFSDGASCDLDSQCKSDICMPSKHTYGAGICFSLAVDWCVVVTEPSPVFALCSSKSQGLYVCGLAYQIELLGPDCTDVFTGDFGEHYHCCKKPLPIERRPTCDD